MLSLSKLFSGLSLRGSQNYTQAATLDIHPILQVSQNDDDPKWRKDPACHESGLKQYFSSDDYDYLLQPTLVQMADGKRLVAARSSDRYSKNWEFETQFFSDEWHPQKNKNNELSIETYASAKDISAQLISLANGGMVKLSADNKIQIYDDDGARVGDAFSVFNDLRAGNSGPQIAPLADGGFMACWVKECRSYDLKCNAVAQRFNADGTRIGHELALGNPAWTVPVQIVTRPQSGDCVVFWLNNVPDAGFDFRIIDSSNQLVGDLAHISTNATDELNVGYTAAGLNNDDVVFCHWLKLQTTSVGCNHLAGDLLQYQTQVLVEPGSPQVASFAEKIMVTNTTSGWAVGYVKDTSDPLPGDLLPVQPRYARFAFNDTQLGQPVIIASCGISTYTYSILGQPYDEIVAAYLSERHNGVDYKDEALMIREMNVQRFSAADEKIALYPSSDSPSGPNILKIMGIVGMVVASCLGCCAFVFVLFKCSRNGTIQNFLAPPRMPARRSEPTSAELTQNNLKRVAGADMSTESKKAHDTRSVSSISTARLPRNMPSSRAENEIRQHELQLKKDPVREFYYNEVQSVLNMAFTSSAVLVYGKAAQKPGKVATVLGAASVATGKLPVVAGVLDGAAAVAKEVGNAQQVARYSRLKCLATNSNTSYFQDFVSKDFARMLVQQQSAVLDRAIAGEAQILSLIHPVMAMMEAVTHLELIDRTPAKVARALAAYDATIALEALLSGRCGDESTAVKEIINAMLVEVASVYS